jgi:hypothetical protein
MTTKAGRHTQSRSYPINHRARPSCRAFFIQEQTMTDTIAITPAAATESDWKTTQATLDRLQVELRRHNKTALFDALAGRGVTFVVVSFDGYGDSGQIQNIEVKAGEEIITIPTDEVIFGYADWGKNEPQRSTMTISNAIEQLTYDFLDTTHCGWENNEGAYGEFTFDVAARTITLDFNERFIESEHSQDIF